MTPGDDTASAVDGSGHAAGRSGGEADGPPAAPREGEAKILDAARGVLVEEGLESLSMRAVASRAGVSATAIYHYFENKRDLVDRLVDTTFERHESHLRAAASRWPAGSVERLRAIAEGYIHFALEHEEHFRALFALRSERLREMEDHPARGLHELTIEAVTAAMEAGELEPRDPVTVGLYLWSSVHGLVTLSLACKLEAPPGGERVGVGELFERTWEMMLDGLRPRPGPGADEDVAGEEDELPRPGPRADDGTPAGEGR